MEHVVCTYCGQQADLYTGASLYPRRPSLAHAFFYHCKPCDATVSCHPGTSIPKGTLADAKLRKARLRAHQAFDPLWQKGFINRSNAYAWLARQMQIDVDYCHMALFNLDECEQVIRICNNPALWKS